MILYIDESGDTNYFVVAGVLVKNESSLLMAHKSFTKHVKSFSMKDKDKRKIFTEFKSTLIDDSYPAIKKDLLNHLIELNPQIIYSYTELSGNKMYQETKENEYIKSLKKIVNYINDDVAIYFDRFNKSDFEKRIISELQKLDNVILIDKKDSLNNKGIQFADNVCSVIRRKLSGNDDNNYFSIIEKYVKKS